MSEELTMQRYYDETISYLLEQERAASDRGHCFYLTEDGNKCAVGYWIPDGHPAQGVIMGVIGLAEIYPDLKGVAWPDHPDGLVLASKLQALHDSPSRLREGGIPAFQRPYVRSLAVRFDLEPYDFASRKDYRGTTSNRS